MLIRFTRAKNDRPHTFTCIREDGTTSGMRSSAFFVRHDLTHYAVETVLKLGEGFYGLVASGWDISSFEEREPGSRKSRKLPPQALFAEFLVGTLDLETFPGMVSNEDLRGNLMANCGNLGVPMPTDEQLERIRKEKARLLEVWAQASPGEVLELSF